MNNTGYNSQIRTCPVCGAKYESSANPEICPYCGKSPAGYQYTAAMRKKALIKKRKNHIKKITILVSFFLFVFLILSLICSLIFSDKEPLIYQTDERKNQPVFFTANNDEVYYLSPKGEKVFIGVGKITEFYSSANGKRVPFLFTGKTSKDSVGTKKDYLMLLLNYKKLTVAAENSEGAISFAAGGDCEYLYYLINESDGNESSARLYLKKKNDEPVKISDLGKGNLYNGFSVSPNGHYILYKSSDDGGTKLIKYNAKRKENENLGVKNCEPASIDNKGEYFSYVKTGTDGSCVFVIQKSATEKESVEIGKSTVENIFISPDRRSYAVFSDGLTFLKTLGTDSLTLISAPEQYLSVTEDRFVCYSTLGNNEACAVKKITDCNFGKGIFPFYYYDAPNKQITAVLKDGSKNILFSIAPEYYKKSEDGKIAFVSGKKLYTGILDYKNSKQNLIMEEFSDCTLNEISPDGNYIFYEDSDGNLFRIPYEYKKTEPLKLAVDAENLNVSENGLEILFESEGMFIYRNQSGKTIRIAEYVVPQYSAFAGDGFTDLVYLAPTVIDGLASEDTDLYQYSGNKSKLIAGKVKEIYALKPYMLQTYSVSDDEKSEEAEENGESAEPSEAEGTQA